MAFIIVTPCDVTQMSRSVAQKDGKINFLLTFFVLSYQESCGIYSVNFFNRKHFHAKYILIKKEEEF